ncbi:MAG TPA: cytochrome c oxidase assembly protein [Gemmatimonadaceae bacterium]
MSRSLRSLALGVASLVLPAVASAHPGRAAEPHDLWGAWTVAPAVVLGLVVSAWLYWRGLRALWRRAGRGRVVAPWRAASFAASIGALVLALVSPIDAIAAALFSVHMLQHLLLIMVAAPLMVLGDPLMVMLWALPVGTRCAAARWWKGAHRLRRLWHVLRLAPIAWILHVFTLWLWHMPALYELAIRHELIHAAEHATFFLTALLFWWLPLRPHGRRLRPPVAVLYLFGAALQSTILGALITFARRPWYPSHFGTTSAWGLNPLEDQQLAGLLMWVPAGTIYLIVLLPIVWRMVGGDEPVRPPIRRYRVAGPEPSAAGTSARGTP